MTDILDRIQQLIDTHHNGVKSEFAKKIGVSTGNISDWFKRKSMPSIKAQFRICEIYGVSIDWLNGKEVVAEPSPAYRAANQIPLLAKIPAEFPQRIPESYVEEYIYVPDAPANAYCLQVKGSSMAPELKDGDYVLFLKASTAESGQIVIALDEFGDPMIKRLKKNNGESFLVSDNPEYHSIPWQNEFKIVGVAVRAVSVRKL